jgi:hypothetical protein
MLALPGIAAASFDFQGTLWLSVSRGPRLETWALASNVAAPRTLSDFSPVAIAGVRAGAVAIDANGRLALFGLEGRSSFHLTAVPLGSNPLIAPNADGSLFAVVAANAVHVFRSDDLAPVRSESPCQAEFLWWLPSASQALVACGPKHASALILDVVTGQSELAPAAERPRSALVPLLGSYVQECEQLPCSTPAPLSTR